MDGNQKGVTMYDDNLFDTLDEFDDLRQEYLTDWDDENQQWLADAWENGTAF